MLRRGTSFEWTAGLDMAWGIFKAGGALVQVAVDTDVSEFPALEAGFMIAGVITSKGYVMVTACPLNFSVSDGIFFFFSQRR